MACSRCGLEGHNARTCGRVDISNETLSGVGKVAGCVLAGIVGLMACGVGGCMLCLCIASPSKPGPTPAKTATTRPFNPSLVNALPSGHDPTPPPPLSPPPAAAPPPPAPKGGGGTGRARCCDGTTSPSCGCGGGKGCCARHGGVCGCN